MDPAAHLRPGYSVLWLVLQKQQLAAVSCIILCECVGMLSMCIIDMLAPLIHFTLLFVL